MNLKMDLSKHIYDGEPDIQAPPAPPVDSNLDDRNNYEETTEETTQHEFVIDSQLEPEEDNNVGKMRGVAIKRENARSQIAYLYVASFLAIIVLIFFYSYFRRSQINDLKDLLVTVSGILSGPLGFIIGYYFKVEDENGNK